MKSDPLAFAVHLSRERVIALLGSTARIDYTPPPPEDTTDKAYWFEGQQSEVTERLNADERLIVALHVLGIPNLYIGLAYGVSRECIAQRLRRLGYYSSTNKTGRPKKSLMIQERLVLPVRRPQS